MQAPARNGLGQIVELEKDETKREAYNLNIEGCQLLKEGKVEQAKKKFLESSQKEPNYYEPLYNLGSISFSQGQREEGHRYYQLAWECAQEGVILVSMGRFLQYAKEANYDESLKWALVTLENSLHSPLSQRVKHSQIIGILDQVNYWIREEIIEKENAKQHLEYRKRLEKQVPKMHPKTELAVLNYIGGIAYD